MVSEKKINKGTRDGGRSGAEVFHFRSVSARFVTAPNRNARLTVQFQVLGFDVYSTSNKSMTLIRYTRTRTFHTGSSAAVACPTPCQSVPAPLLFLHLPFLPSINQCRSDNSVSQSLYLPLSRFREIYQSRCYNNLLGIRAKAAKRVVLS